MSKEPLGLVISVHYDPEARISTIHYDKDKILLHGDLTYVAKGSELFKETNDKGEIEYSYDLPKKDKVIKLVNSFEVGKIEGDSDLFSCNFKVTKKEDVGLFDYVTINGIVVGQIVNLRRKDEDIVAEVAILGKENKGKLQMLDLPLAPQSTVCKATEESLGTIMPTAENNLFLGRLHKTKISFHVDPNIMLNFHSLFLGSVRSGKSYAMKITIEEFSDRGVPTVIIDSRGEHVYSIANANSEETKLISDWKLQPTSYGTDYQRFVFSNQNDGSLKINLDHLGTPNFYTEFLAKPSKISVFDMKSTNNFTEEKMAVGLIAQMLFDLRKDKLIPPMLLVVEECEKYIPQERGKDQSVENLTNISFQGGQMALGLMLAGHRAAEIDKSVLSQIQNFFVFKTTWDNDVERMGRMFGGKYRKIVKQLPVGTALACGNMIPFSTMIDFRPAKSQHFGHSQKIEQKLYTQEQEVELKSLQEKLDRLVLTR